MAPKLQRVNAEDFADAPDWFRRFLDLLNPFLGDTTREFSNNNSKKQVERFRLVTKAIVENTFSGNSVQVKNKLSTKPVEVRVGQVFCRTVNDSISTGTSAQWELLQNGLIRISFITGLNAMAEYDITLIIE